MTTTVTEGPSLSGHPRINTTGSPTHQTEVKISFATTKGQKAIRASEGYIPLEIKDFSVFLIKGFLWRSHLGVVLVNKRIFIDWCNTDFDKRLEIAVQWIDQTYSPIVWIKSQYCTKLSNEVDEPLVNSNEVMLVR